MTEDWGRYYRSSLQTKNGKHTVKHFSKPTTNENHIKRIKQNMEMFNRNSIIFKREAESVITETDPSNPDPPGSGLLMLPKFSSEGRNSILNQIDAEMEALNKAAGKSLELLRKLIEQEVREETERIQTQQETRIKIERMAEVRIRNEPLDEISEPPHEAEIRTNSLDEINEPLYEIEQTGQAEIFPRIVERSELCYIPEESLFYVPN